MSDSVFPIPLRPLGGAGDAADSRKVVRFVILGCPRSGSTLLTHALREHPSIRMYGEVFQDELEARREGFGALGTVYETGADGATYLAESLFANDKDPELWATGFKMFYSQAREPGANSAWQYLRQNTDIRIIHLVRAHALDAYVSLVEAERSGRWVLELHQAPAPQVPIEIDPNHCLAFLDHVFTHREWVRHVFCLHPVLELSYEKHIETNFDNALTEVQEFIGVPPMRLPALLKKQGLAPVAARVSNYAEICRFLKHTIHVQL